MLILFMLILFMVEYSHLGIISRLELLDEHMLTLDILEPEHIYN